MDSASPPLSFGRYSDAYKSPEQLAHWQEAETSFASGEYLAAWRSFFAYLGDAAIGNVEVDEGEGEIGFRIYQGSRVVAGSAGTTGIVAAAEIARMEKPVIPVMRRLLEVNHVLNYSRFALDANEVISIRFDAPVSGGQPAKLYHALREIALNADYYDDPLVSEFAALSPLDGGRVVDLTEEERRVRREAMVGWIGSTIEETRRLHPEKQAGAVAWLLLALLYRIDYLLVPQGALLAELRRIIAIFYTQDERPYPEKNGAMRVALEGIAARADEIAERDFYRVTSTFATQQAAGPEAVAAVLTDAFNGYNHWRSLGNDAITLACMEYIATYALFTYSLPRPLAELMQLYVRIAQEEFALLLGGERRFRDGESLVEEAIRGEIAAIVAAAEELMPGFAFDTTALRFSSPADFGVSYMAEIQRIVGSYT